MPGVVLNETVDCDNPLLQFFYHELGIMKDVEVLSFLVRNVGSGTEVQASTLINTDDCDMGGQRLGIGRYAATFSATGAGWEIGTHEIEWTYEVVAGDPSKKWRQRFEVLDDALFTTGLGYRTYAESTALRKNSAFANCEVGALQEAGVEVAELIEALTGRFFDPRYINTRYNGTNAGALPLQHPIIGIDQLAIIAGGPASSLLDIDLEMMRIYNRHLQAGLLDPDDRDNPRIEFVTDLAPGQNSVKVLTQGRFQLGRQNIQVGGVFGYTDLDGTPVGRTPRLLPRAAANLMLKRILDPFGLDPFTSAPGRIREAKTRDQQIKFGGAADGGIGSLTGDRAVDDVLLLYMRPAHYGAVADASRSPVNRERP